MLLLDDEQVFEEAVEVLLESMQQSKWATYQVLRNDLLVCFTSEQMKMKFSTCINGKSGWYTMFSNLKKKKKKMRMRIQPN